MVMHCKNIEVCSFACVGTQMIGQKCEIAQLIKNIIITFGKSKYQNYVMQYNKRLYGSHSLEGNPDNESQAAKSWITQAEGFQREFTWDEIERQRKTEGRETICQHTRFAKGLYYNCLISSSTHNPRFEASNLDRKYNFSGESGFCVWNWKSC